MASVRVGDAEVALKLTGDEGFEQNLSRAVSKAIGEAKREADSFFTSLNGHNVVINITADAARVAAEIDQASRGRTATVDVVADAAQAASEIAAATADQDVQVAVLADAAQAAAEIGEATADQEVMVAVVADVAQAAGELADVAMDRDVTIAAVADVAEAAAAIEDLTQAREVVITPTIDDSGTKEASQRMAEGASQGGGNAGVAAAAAYGGKLKGGLAALGVGKFLLDGFKEFGEFESAGKELGVVLSLNAKQSADLAAQAKQLGLDTRFASISAGDAAKAQLELAKGGVDLTKAMSATEQALLLAEAGEIGAGRAAEVAAVQVNSFKLKNEDLAAVADDLVGAANASSASVNDIAEASKFAAPAFALLQKDTLGSKGAFEEMNVVLAGLATQGLKGTLAGTGLRAGMLALVNPSTQAAGEIQRLNAAFARNEDPEGYEKILGRLTGRVEKMSFEQARAELGKLNKSMAAKDPEKFTESMATLSTVLTEQLGAKGPKIQKLFASLSAGYAQSNPAAFQNAFQDALGAIDTVAQTKVKDTSKTFKQLGFDLDGVAAQLGPTGDLFIDQAGKMRPMTEIIPRIAKALDGLSSSEKAKKLDIIFGNVGGTTISAALNLTKDQLDEIREKTLKTGQAADLAAAKNSGLKGAFSSLSSTIETAQLTIAEGLAPALQQLLKVVTPFIPKIADFVTHFIELVQNSKEVRIALLAGAAALAVFIAPVATAIAAFVGLVAVLKHVYDSNAAFRKTVDDVVAKLKSFIPIVLEVASSLKEIFVEALNIVRAVWKKWGDDILAFIVGTVRGIITSISGAFDVIKGIFKVVTAILTGDWGKAWDGIKDIVEGSVKLITGAVQQLFAAVRLVFSVGVDIVLAVWRVFWDAISGVVKAVSGAVSGVISGLFDTIKGLFTSALDIIRTVWTGFWQALGGFVTAAMDVVKGLITGAFDAVRGFFSKLGDDLKAVWDGFWKALSGIFSAAWDLVVAVVKREISGLTNIFDFVKKAFTEAWQALWKLLSDAMGGIWTTLVDAIRGAIKIAADFFSFVTDSLKNAWRTLWKFLGDIMGDVWSGLVGAVKAAAQFASDLFSGAVTGLKGAWTALFGTLKDGLGAIWSGIVGAVKAAFTFGSDIFDGALAGLEKAWRLVFGTLRTIAADLLNGPQGIANFIGGIFSRIADGIGDAFSGVGGVVSTALSGLKNVVKTVLNPLISSINGVIRGLNLVNPGTDIPSIPQLALGGLARQGRIHLVGELGPEPFIPAVNGRVLSNREARSVLAEEFRRSIGGPGAAGRTGGAAQVTYAPQNTIMGVSVDQVVAEIEARQSSTLDAILAVLT